MRTSFSDWRCSIAQAHEILGDAWTLLVVREAFLGTRRFAAFERNLGIAKNVLADRLDRLVERGVLERVDAGHQGVRFEYALTPMGRDLAVVMTALRQWADRWVFGPGNEPLLVVDRRTGEPIERLRIRAADGSPIAGADLAMVPGPGASPEDIARFEASRRGGSGDGDG